MQLAPIVLFVYNRPWHTRQTLEALSNNYYADQSELIIFADDSKPNAYQDRIVRIQEVHNLLKKQSWGKTVTIFESDYKKGHANSIIVECNI